jgi:transcriptional regulator with XRE-family HTH domain
VHEAPRREYAAQRGALHMECYARLREERLRLDLSRERVAEVAGADQRTIKRWESKSSMRLDALVALTREGYDAQYVCTGRRSVNNKASGGRARNDPSDAAYSPQEIEWIKRLRQLEPEQRRQLKAVLDALAPKSRKTRKKRVSATSGPASAPA